MPRTTSEILAQADELAKRFEEHEPDLAEIRDARALRDVAKALTARARAEGHSWTSIGIMLGTSGEAARQRYGRAPTR
jgi:hypothetical protein